MTGSPSAEAEADWMAPQAGSTGCPGGGGTPIEGGGNVGGGTPPPPTTPIECDPQLNPACYKPLTKADSAAIASAFGYLRAPASIPDATARQQCENMHNAFNTLYTNRRVFRGATTTVSSDPGLDPHTGAWDQNTGKMHIDPLYLDRAAQGTADAVRELLDTMLHEAAHALMFDHPSGYVSTHWGPVFSDPYFDLLSPGTNSCISW